MPVDGFRVSWVSQARFIIALFRQGLGVLVRLMLVGCGLVSAGAGMICWVNVRHVLGWQEACRWRVG